MHETPDELIELQQLIDDSFARAGEHLLGIMRPTYALSAVQTVAYLQGVRQLALATVTRSGEPRVTPVDGVFHRGRFYTSSDAGAWKIRHLRARSAVSVTHFRGDDLAIIVHGRAQLIERRHPQWNELGTVWRSIYQSIPADWSPNALYVRINPARMITYCRHPEQIPELAA